MSELMHLPTVAVVMPAFNEAEGIASFITDIAGAFTREGWRLEICLVDDCSTDRTASVAREAANGAGLGLTVVTNNRNRGHGPSSIRAWKMGLEADVDLVLHVDGDGQFDPLDIVRVARAALDSAAAVGVRRSRHEPWFRRLISHSLRIYFRIAFGSRCRDVNTPLRAYHPSLLAAMLSVMPTDPTVPSIYLSAISAGMGIEVTEVAVASLPRRGMSDSGTTWGTKSRTIVPPTRLVRFVARALRESAAVFPRLRRLDYSDQPLTESTSLRNFPV